MIAAAFVASLLMQPPNSSSPATLAEDIMTSDANFGSRLFENEPPAIVKPVSHTVRPSRRQRSGLGDFRPDRPRFVPRPDIVGDDSLAVEVGYFHNAFSSIDTSTFFWGSEFDGLNENTGNILVRYGLNDDVELRFAGSIAAIEIEYERFWTAQDSETDVGGSVDGGFKWSLSDQNGSAPELALLGEAGFLKIGDTNSATGDVLLLTEWEIGAGFATGLSGGLLFDSDGDTGGVVAGVREKRFEHATLFTELVGTSGQELFAQLAMIFPIGQSAYLDLHGGYNQFETELEDAYSYSYQPVTVSGRGGFVGVGLTILKRLALS